MGTAPDEPEQLNALAKLAELQREAPDLAGRRMRYPGSASRAAACLSAADGPVPTRSSDERNACGWHEPKVGHRLTAQRQRPDSLGHYVTRAPDTAPPRSILWPQLSSGLPMSRACVMRHLAEPRPFRAQTPALVTTWCPGAGGGLFAEATPPAYGTLSPAPIRYPVPASRAAAPLSYGRRPGPDPRAA
jgi:hypothetical protein